MNKANSALVFPSLNALRLSLSQTQPAKCAVSLRILIVKWENCRKTAA